MAEQDDFYKKRLGSLLNRDKVKLWEAPYSNSDGSSGEISKEFYTKYSEEIGIPEQQIEVLVETLRTHALQKLTERETFKKSGKATLKIKLPANHTSKDHVKGLSVEQELSTRGVDLRRLIADKIGQSPDRLKMITSGKVVNDQQTLQEQNIKNGSQILVLYLPVSQTEAEENDKLRSAVQDTRFAAELLSQRAENDMDYEGMDIQIADQTGKPVQLPAQEKKALTLAMTLHEKGRQALKRKEVMIALPLLLEADKEFKLCRSAILDSVDNYAILCLDIVWCYLCLKNMEDLPDAAERLRTSESFFQKSYGSDLERLIAVKGSSGEELALFMRLHLLQGIVNFHQQNLDEAARLLSKAQSEFDRLKVDEDKLTEVMSMGFSEAEGRLGLRHCNGDIPATVTHIMKRQEEKKEVAQKVKEERRKKKLSKSLGKAANGQSVNIDNYEMLIGMGFPKGAAAEAIRQSNNDVGLALEVLQTHPEFLDLPDPEPKHKLVITDALIAQVTNLGFEPEMARRALVKWNTDVQRAIDELVRSGGMIEAPIESPGTSTGAGATSGPSHDKSPEEIQQEKEALDRLVADIPASEEDYLDVTLDEEHAFLLDYLTLIKSLKG